MNIPKTVIVDGDKKKVAILGNNFCKSQALDLVNIPNSVRKLNNYAFASSKVKRVNIPSSTVEYGNGLFSSCTTIEHIDIDDNNPVVKDIDGVVFTKTGKTLIMYPMAKSGDSYTINPGTEAIGKCAFNNSNIKSVSIPSSVKRINTLAFLDSKLTSINIPNTVQEIRKYLFLWMQKSNIDYNS